MHRKVQRGRPTGYATRNNNIDFGQYALVAMEPVWLSAKHIEAARVAINRCMNRKGQLWIRVFPDKPISKKPADTRQGKGKGAPESWAAVVRPGMILFEIAGIEKELADECMHLAASKLPIKTKFAYRPTID